MPLSLLTRLRLVLLGHEDLANIVFWAALVGLCAALSSVAFREGLRLLEQLFTGQSTSLELAASRMVWWHRVLLPLCGAVLAGFVLRQAGRMLASPRAVDYMEAVRVGDGSISVRATLANSLSSLLTISSGGSIGREGPMVQLAAMLGSRLGRLARAPIPRRRLMVACGGAAGIAAAYNAPISGALFVSEIILGGTAMESFGPLVVASVVSSATVHRFLGYSPVYDVPKVHFASNWELIFYVVLGVVLGHLAPPFLASLDFAKSRFVSLKLPLQWQLGLGGLLVGVISVAVPEVWGNGFGAVGNILNAHLVGWWLLAVLLAKLLATAATVGSGAVGGVFTPTLFLGCAMGALFGGVLHSLLPGMTSVPAAYALVGMGGFLAATTHAPLTAILMLFEMTQDYDMVLPLMLACVTAHYTAKVYRRGESIYHAALSGRATGEEWHLNNVAALIKPAAAVVSQTMTVKEMFETLPRRPLERAYVTDGDELIGWLDLRELLARMRNTEVDGAATVAAMMRPVTLTLTDDLSLGAALDIFLRARANTLPVTGGEWRNNLLGEISRQDVLLAMQDRMVPEPGSSAA
ncbi:MAG TPA: ClcB-like voltage-gated chloride channel protein [Steroidobacteraceae bacterium]